MGMTTQKPIDTNCGSAPKSTGTASPEGKTASRVNALELEALAAGCHDSFEPAGAHQRLLIDSHRCRLAIPPSRISRRRLNQSPLPKDSLRGLNEDGSLDEVFDSLSTGRSHHYRPHLVATPPRGSVTSLTHAPTP